MAKQYIKLKNVLSRLLFEKDMRPMDLAREIDIPQPTIHRIVNGKSTRPHTSSLEAIANYFSISIDQLTGEELLNISSKQETLNVDMNQARNINHIQWDKVISFVTTNEKQSAKLSLTVSSKINRNAFAVNMNDSSMEPIFPKNTILIFDPEFQARDRDYVLVKATDMEIPVFRQLLIDGNSKYLKPLNPDLDAFHMHSLESNDNVLATLIESRNNFYKY